MPSVGIRFDPEAISVALFTLLGTANFDFKTMDRQGQIWSSVNVADQPYFALIERGFEALQDEAIGLTKWRLRYDVLVYIRADANQDPSAPVPATILNAALKAIVEAMNSQPIGEKQTLGGIVNNAWISGSGVIDTGILDQQCAILIPVTVECGL